MNYLSLPIRDLRSEEYLGSEPVDRATWLNLQTYCALLENGGRIEDCKNWGDRKWMQLVGCTKDEALRACKLWSWQGGTLILWAYQVGEEEKVQVKRSAGRSGGKSTSAAKVAAAKRNALKKEDEAETKHPDEAKTKQKPSTASLQKPTSVCLSGLSGLSGRVESDKKPAKSKAGSDAKADSHSLAGAPLKFSDWFRAMLPEKCKPPANWREAWARCYAEMIRIDGRTKDEIKAVCQWARGHDFWGKNFLSPAKLRKRNREGVMYFDVFAAGMEAEGHEDGEPENPKGLRADGTGHGISNHPAYAQLPANPEDEPLPGESPNDFARRRLDFARRQIAEAEERENPTERTVDDPGGPDFDPDDDTPL